MSPISLLLSLLKIKMFGLNLDAHRTQVLPHHICIQVQLQVLLRKLHLIHVVEHNRFQHNTIHLIGQNTTDSRCDWTSNEGFDAHVCRTEPE